MASTMATTGLPITSLINTNTTATQAANAATSTSNSLTTQLGPTAFLQLLTTQLANQDPLNPMDDTQSVAQLAQFSALQASTNLASSFSTFQSNFSLLQSAGLLGKNVAVSAPSSIGGSSVLTGTVSSIQAINGQPEFTLSGSNGQTVSDGNGNTLFTLSQLLGIG